MGIKTKIAEELAKRVQGGDSLAMDFATRMARAKESSVSYDANYQDHIDIDDDGYDIFSDPYTLIENVSTPLEHRGKGLARKELVKSLSEIAAKHPDEPVRLSATPLDDDTDADKLVEFYESLGFSADSYSEGMEGIPMSMDTDTLSGFKLAGIAGAVGLGAAGSSQEAEAGIIRPEKRNPALKALSILEPAAMIGSSMARESLAGLGGLAAGLDPYAPEGEGGRFTEYLQRTLPVYEPRTKEGIQGLEALGGGITDIAKYFNDSRLAEPLRAAKENFNESNEWVFDNYGPGAATVLRVLPDIVF
jgi:predicted GNAT family N-acyltransferase